MLSASFISFSAIGVIASFLSIISGSSAVQSFIPLSKTAHAFHRGNVASLTTVELYLDLTCSTCRGDWPLLNEVYDYYKSKVHFEYRIFPLPHHAQAFLLSQAAQVVNVYGKDAEAVFTYMNTVYENQDAIVGETTNSMTYDQVVDMAAEWATYKTGVKKADYYTGMNASTTVGNQCSVDARNMWKYGAVQGLFVTILILIYFPQWWFRYVFSTPFCFDSHDLTVCC